MWMGGEYQSRITEEGLILEKVGRVLGPGERRQLGKGIIQH